MSRRNIIIGFVFALIALFFAVQSQNALSFGHPDANRPGPYVEITSPASGTPFKSSAAITIAYTATDPYGVSSMALSGCKRWTGNDGSALILTDRGVVSCGTGQTTTISAGWCRNEGTNKCVARITGQDTAGYTSQHEIFLTIDDTPPVVHLSSNRGNPSEKTDVTFTFFTSDEYGISSVQCDLNGGGFAACASPKTYSGPLLEGNNTFSVRATDVAGNQTTKAITWEIDSQAPAQISSTGLDVRVPSLPEAYPYFSLDLDWYAPDEDSIAQTGLTSSQYDIRYSVAPIDNDQEWNNRTAIIYNEIAPHLPVPATLENMLIGPADLAEIPGLTLGDGSNLLPAYTPLYFAIKTRDEKWNWSERKNFLGPTDDSAAHTQRDPCDYDADRVYSPDCAGRPNQCNPSTQTCDLYDDPFDWQLPNEPNEYTWSEGTWRRDQADEYWTRAFAAATQDLDNDGKDAANGRIGTKVVEKTSPGSFPNPAGTDWYDNPFTLDLLALTTSPRLTQLAHTINDLDLDTFVVKGWRDLIGGTEKLDADISGAINADVNLDASSNSIAGCLYPDELFENRCTDCTAYNPDPATGRIPSNKTAPNAFQNKAVCQIEAYYSDLREKTPPYEIIQTGTLKPAKAIFTASAQCQDSLDNDLDGLIDSRQNEADQNYDISCPLTYQPQAQALESPSTQLASANTAGVFDAGGLVQCGRYADDFTTPIDESADCTFCHFFYLFQNIINLLLWRLGLVVLLLAVLWGGFLILTSRGNITQVVSGRKAITIAFFTYALLFLSWAVLNTIFAVIGLMEWTGFSSVGGNVTALTSTAITDNSKNWRGNQWTDYMVEIIPPKGVSGLKSSSGGQDLGSVSAPLAIKNVSWPNDQWNGFELIIKSGNQANEIRTITDTISPNQLVLNRTVGTPSSALAIDDIIDINDFKQPLIRRVLSNTADSLTLDSPQPLELAASPSYHILNTGWWSFACGISAVPSANFIAAPSGGGPNLSVDSEGATSYIAKSGRASVAEPLTVYFTHLSQGDIVAWAWDLDGDSQLDDSTEKSPTFTYTSESPVTITLRVTGPTGSSTKQQTINFAPQANFSAGDTGGYTHGRAPFAVTFSDSSSRATAWSWEFGDGTRDCCGNNTVTHTYSKPGPYSPRLTVTGPGGADTKVKLNYLFVYPQPKTPAASFSVAVSIEDNAKLKAVFTNTSLLQDGGEYSPDEITHWEWDFDNNGAIDSTVKDPTYYYQTNSAGYSAKLTARGPGGEHSATQSVVFPPRARFNADARSGPLTLSGNFAVQFDDASIGTVSAWSWDFGDGTHSSSQNPRHLYTSNGAYTVSLTARHPGQDDSTAEKTSYIVVTPGAYFSASDLEGYAPLAFTSTNNSRCTGCTYAWGFGDGTSSPSPSHTYKNEVYQIYLTATDTGGRSHRAGPSTLKVWANPKFKISACGGSIEGAPPTGTIDCEGKYEETITLESLADTHENIKEWKFEIDSWNASPDGFESSKLFTRRIDTVDPISMVKYKPTFRVSDFGSYKGQFTVIGAAVGETDNLSTRTSTTQDNFINFTPVALLSASGPDNYKSHAGQTRTVSFSATDSDPNPTLGGTTYSWSGCSAGNTDSCSITTATCDGGSYSATVQLTNNGGTDSASDSHSWSCQLPGCLDICADSTQSAPEYYQDTCTYDIAVCCDDDYEEYDLYYDIVQGCGPGDRCDSSACLTPKPIAERPITPLNRFASNPTPKMLQWLKASLSNLRDFWWH